MYINKAIIMTLHLDDHSRVVLSVPDEDGSDYINASFIDVSVLCMCTMSCILRAVHVDIDCTQVRNHTDTNTMSCI